MDIDERLKNALCNNDRDFLSRNLNVHFDINHRLEDEDDDTILSYALGDKDSTVFEWLFEMNPDLNVVNAEGETLLHSAGFSGDAERLKLLLERATLDINAKANDGTTPLLQSVLLEKSEIFDYLISIGANVNSIDNEGIAPLHMACQLGNIKMVKALVKKGADLFLKTNKGNYPLALAVNNNHKEVVRFIYERMNY